MAEQKYQAKNELLEWFALTKRDIPMWFSVGFFFVGFISRGMTPLLIITFLLSLIFCVIGSVWLFVPNPKVSTVTNIYRILSGVLSIFIAVGLMAFKILFFLNKGLY